jgi:hypothetical protein
LAGKLERIGGVGERACPFRSRQRATASNDAPTRAFRQEPRENAAGDGDPTATNTDALRALASDPAACVVNPPR